MLFNSYAFIFLFLPITIGLFAVASRFTRRAAVAILILCSAAFYAYWSPSFLLLLTISLVVNYFIGTVWLAADAPASRKVGLIVGLTFNLGALAYFKYTNLLISSFNTATGSAIPLRNIVLPLGISFFTFQKVAYLVDTYKGRGYSRNFLDYCLFVLFFPQLIAGPIVHPREILPQFSRRPRFGITAKNLSIGLSLFALGLVKKVILADNIAPNATRVFSAAAVGTAPEFFTAWMGALAYTLQIYFDFSGYSDMAIGLARIFAIRLPVNFNSPYKAHSISDFWRRWHMTLSRLLRDYLYIPLGGNRKGPFRRYINLMLTMLLGGLWHGASWTFVAWGGLHGLYLIVHQAFSRREHVGPPVTIWQKIWKRGVTFLAVVVAWVSFRADNFPAAQRILAGMSGLNQFDATRLRETGRAWMTIIALLVVAFACPNTQQIMALARPALGVLPPRRELQAGRLLWRPTAAWATVLALLLLSAVISLSKATEFIYFQF